jgi:hypothetical protein
MIDIRQFHACPFSDDRLPASQIRLRKMCLEPRPPGSGPENHSLTVAARWVIIRSLTLWICVGLKCREAVPNAWSSPNCILQNRQNPQRLTADCLVAATE